MLYSFSTRRASSKDWGLSCSRMKMASFWNRVLTKCTSATNNCMGNMADWLIWLVMPSQLHDWLSSNALPHNWWFLMPSQPHDWFLKPSQPHDWFVIPSQPHNLFLMPHQPHDWFIMPSQPHDWFLMPSQPHDWFLMPSQPHDWFLMPSQQHYWFLMPSQPHDWLSLCTCNSNNNVTGNWTKLQDAKQIVCRRLHQLINCAKTEGQADNGAKPAHLCLTLAGHGAVLQSIFLHQLTHACYFLLFLQFSHSVMEAA